jgi:predicted TIM-barrel fold metal-dependent hydrolase
MDDLRIIDCDSHLTEPPDLWSSRVPRTMLGRVPEHRTVDGTTLWFLGGEPWSTIGANTIDARGKRIYGTVTVQPFEEVNPACWRVVDRLRLLDEEGIFAQLLYPNGIGFASNHIFAIEDVKDRELILQVYNDFLVDVQEESGGRLFPQAMLPIWDIDLTVREMTRLLDKGIRGFTLSDKPEALGMPEPVDPHFDPIWDVFNESGAVVNFHIAAGRTRAETQSLFRQVGFTTGETNSPYPQGIAHQERPPSPFWEALPVQRRLVTVLPQRGFSNIRVISNLCVSNLFDRFPKLKVSSVESGLGWVPFVLECLEHEFDEMVTNQEDLTYSARRPTEYFRDHITVGFAFETFGPMNCIEHIGAENVLVESDIPHGGSVFPGFRERILGVLKAVDPDVQRRVLQDNASERYRIGVE